MADQRQLWPLRIDWKRGLVMSAEYKTEIFASRDKHEYRRAARVQPRFSYEYTGAASGEAAQALSRVLDTLIDETLIFGNPIFRTRLVTPLIAATTVFNVADVPAWLVVGAYVVLAYSGSRFLAIVDDVTGDQVTIDAPAAVTFPSGAKLFLGVQSRVNPATKLTFLTNTVATGKITLDDFVGLNYVPDTGVAYSLYNSKEVLLKKPNWISPVERSIDAGVDVVDFTFGRRSYDSYLDFVPHILKAEYIGRTWDEAIDFLQFFMRNKGRRGEFYMPSPIADLPISNGLTSGQTTFRVSGSAYADYDDNPAQRNVSILLRDGTRLNKRVTNAAADGDETVFTVTGAWASGVAREQIVSVGWLNTYRFAVDELSLEWLTDSVVQFSTSFQLLHDLDEAL